MPVIGAPLVPAQYVPNSNTTLYTSAPGTRTRIEKVLFVNGDAASHTVTVWVVPAGAIAGNANLTTNAQAIAAGVPWNSPNEPGLWLAPGDSIVAVASAASVINVSISGTQFT